MMLDYHTREWRRGVDAPGAAGKLVFSRARRFELAEAPEQRLEIGVAAQRRSGASLLRVISSGHRIAVDDTEFFTVMLPRNGRVAVRYGREEVATEGAGAIAFAPSVRSTRVFAPRQGAFEAFLLKLPISHPLLAANGLAGAAAGAGDPHLRIRADAAEALADLLRYVLTDLSSPSPVLRMGRPASLADVLLEEHACKLFEPPGAASPSGDAASARLIRDARDLMRERFAEPLSVAEIAAAVGVGTRRLQGVFKAETGGTLWEHLTAIRLENVRLRLSSAREGATVTMIAMDCGFTHLGRFSQRYRLEFGEPPSRTLRQAAEKGPEWSKPVRNSDSPPRDKDRRHPNLA